MKKEVPKDKFVKAFHRLARIDSGVYNKPAHIVFKDKKKYSRKAKHQTNEL